MSVDSSNCLGVVVHCDCQTRGNRKKTPGRRWVFTVGPHLDMNRYWKRSIFDNNTPQNSHNSPIYDECQLSQERFWHTHVELPIRVRISSRDVDFGNVMITGSSRLFQRYPTTYESQVPFTLDLNIKG